ncbi:MAG: LytR C-terminal domain-containing protein [Candidatus Delongbacteria bacterium]|nr:LytR C-terminal domain-containing protein [Candidatus Delongbacteria bacterium]
MPRIKNKKTPIKETKESNWFLYVIISILTIQTVFLLYKNYDYIADNISSTETEFITENNGSDDQDNKIKHNGDYSDLNRPVRVSILNGCGKSGLAGKWKIKLRDLKYDIRETGNADKNYINSIVLSRIKNMKPAFDLAKKLGIPDKDVLLQINKDIVDIDVSLILGKDYKNLK